MLFEKIMKVESKIIVQVIFHIDGDFNNSRILKKIQFLASYKVVN